MTKAIRFVKEAAVEHELIARVHRLGGLCLKVTVIGRRGFFDRIVLLPGGRVIFVEVKRPHGGRVSPHQISYAVDLGRLGAVLALIRNSADIDELLGADEREAGHRQRPGP